MRVVLLHGVGLQRDNCKAIRKFSSELAHRLAATVELWMWDSPRTPVPDQRNTWLWSGLRNFVYEAINDFAHVSRNVDNIVKLLPEADVYIGHSAGGVLAYETNKTACLLGSPAQLVRNIKATAPVLNLMHYLDPIAAPVEGADNRVIYKPLLKPWVSPVAAHTDYWSEPYVLHTIVDWIESL
jgi:hypothetical protein